MSTPKESPRERFDKARGVAPPLIGKPASSVGLPKSYWGDRQKGSLQELLSLLPVIESVLSIVPTPTIPEGLDEQQKIEFLVNYRLDSIMRAKSIVAERLRKEL